MSFRILAIAIEVVIMVALTYSLLLGMRLTVFDIGLEPKYDRFLKWVLAIVGCLISAFFVAHLTLFYPKLLP